MAFGVACHVIYLFIQSDLPANVHCNDSPALFNAYGFWHTVIIWSSLKLLWDILQLPQVMEILRQGHSSLHELQQVLNGRVGHPNGWFWVWMVAELVTPGCWGHLPQESGWGQLLYARAFRVNSPSPQWGVKQSLQSLEDNSPVRVWTNTLAAVPN